MGEKSTEPLTTKARTSTMAFIQPLVFADDMEANWKLWLQKFKIFLLAEDLQDSSDERKVALLLHSMGDKGVEIYNSFGLSHDEKQDFEDVVKRFDAYFIPRMNITMQRHKFFTRVQGPSESFDDFLTDLRNKSASCDFKDMRDELIRDFILIGLNNITLKERLLRTEDLTLQKATTICKAAELSLKQVTELTTSDTSAVLHVSTKTKTRKCFRCGNNWDRSHQCPAMGAKCQKCGIKNHYSKVCRNKQVAAIKEEQQTEQDSEETFFVGSVKLECEWIENLIINDQSINAKLDTGAQVNCMSYSTFKMLKLNDKFILNKRIKIVTLDDKCIPVKGTCNIKTYLKNGKCDNIEFVIVSSECMTILGLPSCIKLKLVTRNMVSMIQVLGNLETNRIMSQYSDLFDGIGCFKKPYKIVLQESAIPRADPPRRVPLALRDSLRNELDNMERLQIIIKNEDPGEWVNSVVVTKKKNNKIRVCIDPRYLNKFIVRKHKQLPTVEDILDKLSGSKYFTKFDCSSGFWTVQLDAESSKLCTFSTPFGNYSYRRLPFGLSVSTEAFQERMEEAFGDIENVQFYVDDLIIYANTVEEHNNVLLKVLKRAQECNVKFNREKSQVLSNEISFLGMIVSDKGVIPDSKKVTAISELKQICDKKELERFLGMTNYLSKFIENYSSITTSLRELLRKDIIFQWLPSHETAFQKLKEALINAPTLKLFDSNKDIVVSVDSSSEGVGACLLQDRQPVAYASKALTECQKGYAQVEREMFAIVFGCVKFHKYILGKRVLVETDHSALEILFKKPLSLVPVRLQRMMLKIQGYDIIVKYVPGKYMYISDF
jgi:hypothetical protein